MDMIRDEIAKPSSFAHPTLPNAIVSVVGWVKAKLSNNPKQNRLTPSTPLLTHRHQW
ncbi:MAG: hypothetical protein F6K44_01595 [Moorea sp. SIO3E2]|uniref:hypothetical protein n=1 Tax=Moorena sp. SIO4E2 TaxID=2607826 RepID=UPI0013BB5C2B|nr:hypothetical protein [Moorena sp. SIO4E2]NEQ07984.1 hypothetical protein [Moorena sp. SIO4E2]NEQ12631.1 hypothetical protein [Moorena sp. SIO3E2]